MKYSGAEVRKIVGVVVVGKGVVVVLGAVVKFDCAAVIVLLLVVVGLEVVGRGVLILGAVVKRVGSGVRIMVGLVAVGKGVVGAQQTRRGDLGGSPEFPPPPQPGLRVSRFLSVRALPQ